MRKFTKKAGAALICGALLCSAASCGTFTRTALTVDGNDVRAGVYIYYQMLTLNEASNKLSEEQPDLDQNAEDFDILSCNVEGTPIRDWVKTRAIDRCREFVAIEKLMQENGLALTDDQNAEIKTYVNGVWNDENMYAQYIYGYNILGEYYESLGIGKQSYQETYATSFKRDTLFDYYYGAGGVKEISADELNASVKENNALIKYFEVDPLVAEAQSYVDMLNSGTAFAEVKQSYELAKELYDVNKAMADAEANGEEYDGTLPEDVTAGPLADEKSLQYVVPKNATSPSEEFVSAVFALADGENKVVTDTTGIIGDETGESLTTRYYVVSRLDITADQEAMDNNRESQRHTLKDDEFKQMLADKGNELSLSENKAATDRYKLEKLTGKN